jgi:hypothetical protein
VYLNGMGKSPTIRQTRYEAKSFLVALFLCKKHLGEESMGISEWVSACQRSLLKDLYQVGTDTCDIYCHIVIITRTSRLVPVLVPFF